MKNLINRIANGDMDALEQLYAHTYSKIRPYIYSIVRDINICEDVLHDTYIKVVEKAHLYIPIFDDERWIMRIARNLSINALKQNNLKRHLSIEENIEYKYSRVNDLDDTSEILICLNDEERMAIKLKVAGFSYKEIEIKTGWSVRKITYLINCAKKKIKNKL